MLKYFRNKEVPELWLNSLDLNTGSLFIYLERLTAYCSYIRDIDLERNKFWISAIRKPQKLLQAFLFEYATSTGCSMEDVKIEVSINGEEPDKRRLDFVVLTGLTLVSANVDKESSKIVPAHHKSYNEILENVVIYFKIRKEIENEEKKHHLYNCPVYETTSR